MRVDGLRKTGKRRNVESGEDYCQSEMTVIRRRKKNNDRKEKMSISGLKTQDVDVATAFSM